MLTRAIKLTTGVVVMVVVATGGARAGEKEKPAGQGAGQAAIEKMMEEFAKPAAQHEEFKELVGQWKADVKSFWENPKKPELSTGTSTMKMILGGRYLQQQFRCQMGGKTYEGLGISAYEKAQKKYVSIWIDNMGTGIMLTEGKYDKATDTFTETGESSSPMGPMKLKMVTKSVNKDQFVFTMYVVTADGTESKSMEITYTRKK